jgi:leucyl-tRNA synthetase
MAQKYGADTGRLYTLFAAPPEKDLEWSEESIEGSWRFLNRVYRLIERHAEAVRGAAQFDFGKTPMSDKERELIGVTYRTLERVTADFESRWHFNSAIALLMELTNEIYAAEPLGEGTRPEVRKEVLEMLTLMLAPMVPHLAEELWEILGHSGGLWNEQWPDPGGEREELAREDEVEIPVQINGKLRGRLSIVRGEIEASVVAAAQGDSVIAPHLVGKRIVKRIYVPNKLLNLVVG